MQENLQEITTGLCAKNTLIFFPRDALQAVYIQDCLRSLGIRKAGSPGFDKINGQQCVNEGLVVLNGEIYTGAQAVPDKSNPPLFSNAKQFEEPAVEPTASQETLQAAQNLFDNLTVEPKPDKKATLVKYGQDLVQPIGTDNKDESGLARLKYHVREKRPVDEELLTEALQELDALVGLEEVKNSIRESIALARENMLEEELGIADDEAPSRHMVFTGPPGTGKTTVAAILAKIYYALGYIDRPEAVDVSREDFVGEYIGHTEKKTVKLIESALGGMLFIDEAYSLAADDSKRDFGLKAINLLNNAMEKLRDNIVIVIAGYPKEMQSFMDSNPGLASRFPTYIPFKSYSIDDLGLILDRMLEKRHRTLTPEARAYAVQLLENDKTEKEKDGKAFGNARIVRNVVDKLKQSHALNMMNAGLLDAGHGGLSKDALKKIIMTYTLDDAKNISLSGIAAETTEGKKPEQEQPANAQMGFGKPGSPIKKIKLAH